MIYVGIDVHRSFHQVAIITDEKMRAKGREWEKSPQLKITSNRDDFNLLLEQLSEYKTDDVCIAIDHTGGYYSAPLVNFLVNAGYELCYIHPSGLRNFKKGKKEYSKTDKIDAAYMARALYYHKTHGDDYHFSMLNPKIGTDAEVLQTMLTQRQVMTKLKTQTANRLHQLLIAAFPEAESTCFTQLIKVLPEYPSAQEISNAPIVEFSQIKGVHARKLHQIRNLAKDTIGIDSVSYSQAIKRLAIQYNQIDEKLGEINRQIVEISNQHPYSKILLSIPGIGEAAAATLIAGIKDINYFETRQKLQKNLGVAPNVTQSGSSAGKRKLSQGNKDCRRVLFQAVFTCISSRVPDNPFKEYYQRKRLQGLQGTQAIVNTMSKMVNIIFHLLKNGEFYEYEKTPKINQVTKEEILLPAEV